MARTKSNGTNPSTANIGFEAKLWLTAIPVPPMTAVRASAFLDNEAKPKVVSEARDTNANFAWVQHFIHQDALDENSDGRQTLN